MRRVLAVVAGITAASLVAFILHLLLPRGVVATGRAMPLSLAGGPFSVSCFAGGDEPRGIVVLGTGDGGWSYWEENAARHLAEHGFVVAGWDCRRFADTRAYDQDQLGTGFEAAVQAARDCAEATDADLPIWYGGWSTGAEQAVAAATSAHRPDHLVGLLLAAPGTHGRYGITTTDLLGVDPSGPGSFSLADMAPQLTNVRVAQFAAGLDPLDDTDWIAGAPDHRVFALPRKLHDMGGAGPEFLRRLDDAIAWTLEKTKKT